mmetsp:Transcript_62073/g.183434  ORF Transcript_62073/g.183434 Transcript_62073/m.183434 type:complete len:231 (+) Transcript_62073:231-923(+)
MNALGTLNFHLNRQLNAYNKEDPSPICVMLCPLAILLWIQQALGRGKDTGRAIANLCILAFFFLLWTGENSAGGRDTCSTPFCLWDVNFHRGERRYHAHRRSITDAYIDATDFIGLRFDDHKNAIKGEQMGHGRFFADAILVAVISNHMKYLRFHRASADVPLCAALEGERWRSVQLPEIMAALQAAACTIRHCHGVTPNDISTRSMRSVKTMALFLAGIRGECVKILER